MPVLRAADNPVCDANNAGIQLPAGFCALLVADGLGEARHMTVAANGDLYVALQNGGIAALRSTKGDGRFDVKEKFGAAIVAVDASTGRTRWVYQTVHHDVWDYDVPSQPTLLDLAIGGDGFGFAKRKDWMNVDLYAICEPDLILDLNKTPWPFETGHFLKIYANDVMLSL